MERIVPILSVRDLPASIAFYVDVLGFQRDWLHESPGHLAAGISRDNCSIYLVQAAQGQPGTWLWIGVEDVAIIHEMCRKTGAVILQPPTNYSWGYEMRIQDPDGHVLRFASEPLDDRPFND